VDRRFWVADGRRAEFEAVFGLSGLWPQLLRKASGYLLTELRCEDPELLQYRVRDCWEWHRGFERFRSASQAEFERFEEWLRSERLIQKEQFLGAYYEKSGGETDFGFELKS
jgi:hypothetical protein